MKKLLSLFLFVLIFPLSIFASKNDAYGRWITERGSNGNRIIVDIYEKGNKVYGKIHQLEQRFDDKGELRKDHKNPDASKRNRTLEGIDFVSDFTYNEKTKKYEKGKIYDPSTGKSYACFMELQSDGSLKVRGHLAGLKVIGKTQIWRRYK